MFYCYRTYTVSEVVSMLEADDNYASASVTLMPPDGDVSEIDSGDEDSGGDINNLSGAQLRAGAEVTIRRYDAASDVVAERPIVSSDESEESDTEVPITPK